MSVVNLKDEKRINVNGEWDKVTTHPNNEPIYRSNGHQLELNASNSDYVALGGFKTIQNGESISIVFELKNTVDNTYITYNNSTFNDYFFTTNNSLKLITNGNFQSIGALQDGINEFTLRRELGVNYVSINGGSEVTVNEPLEFSLNSISRSSSNQSFNIYSFEISSETFNPVDINSSAQIEGSNGTIAQVNSSAADPINYILGDVFNKSGFALSFDAGNSEYISLNTEASFTGDFFIEFDIDSELDSNNQVLGINESGQTNISLFGGGKIYYNTDGQSAYLSAFGILPFTGRFKYKIERVGVNTFFYVDGVQVDTVNNQNGTFTLNRLFASFTQSFSGNVYSLNINGENYPLRRGLGNKILKEGAEAVTALDLVATNSDFISTQFSNTTINETSDIDLEFEFYMDSFDGGRIRLLHFSDENGESVTTNKAFWFETSTTRSGILLRQSNNDGSVNANAFNVGSPIIGLNTVKILNGESFLNGVKTSSDPNNYTLDISNPFLKIARFFKSGQYTDLTLLGFKFKGESFSTQEINSSAQIIGSEGTVAQANTSAAGGTSYILDNIVTPNEATIVSGSADADRINFGMWLSGNDTDGWNPYVTE